jgi:hypothetical protein
MTHSQPILRFTFARLRDRDEVDTVASTKPNTMQVRPAAEPGPATTDSEL